MKKIIVKLCMWFFLTEFIASFIICPMIFIQNGYDISLVIPLILTTLLFGLGYFKLRNYTNKNFPKRKKESITNNKEYGTIIKTSLEKGKGNEVNEDDVSLEKFIELKNVNDQRIIEETVDLIENSKNIETVLGRIEFGYNKGFIKSKDELQIESIKRCYQIMIDSPTPKNKTKRIEKYIATINEHRSEFSNNVIKFLESFIQSTTSPVQVKLENDLPFDENYLNEVLDDGKTVKEHMQEDFENSMMESMGMDKQQNIELNDLEKQFVNTFLEYLKPFNLDTEIKYNRMSSKHLNFKFRGMQIGRIKLNGRKMNIQVLTENDIKWHDITGVDDALKYLDDWIDYLNYLIKA